MMQVTPYLFFNDGLCREAMTTYADILGGELGMVVAAADMPPEFPIDEDKKSWLAHCEVNFPEGKLMGSDSLMGPSEPMAGANVMVNFETRDAAEGAFNRLAPGGETTMPFAPTFWSAGFGMLTDRYGVCWMIGCDEAP